MGGIHWFPSAPVTCAHHEPRYNPWHRVYVDRFEAALRTVPGCESITMPYWDILTPMPEWLQQAPFDSYTLPVEVAPGSPAGYKTSHKPQAEISQSLEYYDVAGDIRSAMNNPVFDDFTKTIESAHDGGHLSISGSMHQPDVAGFDPIFWFFHCNWERLFWAWQRRYDATTLEAFRATVKNPDLSWLETPPFNELEPFGVQVSSSIDSSPYAYEDAADSLFDAQAVVRSGNIPMDRSFRVAPSANLSVRVKGIERLRIAGSFVVHLMADNQSVARRAFFQAVEPTKCPNCVKRAKVNVDIPVAKADIEGKHLEVRIENTAPDRIDLWVPLLQVGTPTINIREMLVSE